MVEINTFQLKEVYIEALAVTKVEKTLYSYILLFNTCPCSFVIHLLQLYNICFFQAFASYKIITLYGIWRDKNVPWVGIGIYT